MREKLGELRAAGKYERARERAGERANAIPNFFISYIFIYQQQKSVSTEMSSLR